MLGRGYKTEISTHGFQHNYLNTRQESKSMFTLINVIETFGLALNVNELSLSDKICSSNSKFCHFSAFFIKF